MLKKVSLTVLTNVLNQFLLFIIFLFSAKQFGPEGRGVISSLVAMMTLIGAITGLSTGRIIMNEIASSQQTAEEYLKREFPYYLWLLVVSSLLGWLILVLIYLFFPGFFGEVRPTFIPILAISLPYYVWSSYSSYFFSTIGIIGLQNKIIVATKFLFIVVLAVLYFLESLSLTGFLILFSVFNALNLALDQYYISKYILYTGLLRPDIKRIRYIIRQSLQIHLDTIGYILYSSMTIVILNIFLDLKEVGLFNFASQLISILVIIPRITSQFINTEIVRGGADTIWPMQKKILLTTIGITAAAAIVGLVFLPIFLQFMKLEFGPSVPLYRALCLSLLFNAFCILMSPQWLVRGKYKFLSTLTLLSGLAGFLLLLLTINWWGVMSAVWANNIIFFIMFIFNLAFYLRLNRANKK